MKTEPAGFWPRLAAFGLDYLVIAAYIVLLTITTWLVLSQSSGRAAYVFGSPALSDLFAFLALVLPVTLYFALCESSNRQATWGKQRMRLRVETTGGRRISLPRSLLRSGLKFLPWQIAHTSLFQIPGWPFATGQIPLGSMIGFGLVWLLVLSYLGFLIFSPAHRTPYELAAGTVVARWQAE